MIALVVVCMADGQHYGDTANWAISFALRIAHVPEPNTSESVSPIISLHPKFDRPNENAISQAAILAAIVGPGKDCRNDFAFPIRRIFFVINWHLTDIFF